MSKRPQRTLRAVVAALGLLAAACSSTPSGTPTTTAPAAGSFPISITAANGTVHIAARPHAIVSLSPTATEMLYAIGAGSQVKAVDKDSDYPPKVPRTNLDPVEPNVEAIAAYKPDLVVVAGDTSNLTERLAGFGIPVLSEPAATTLQDTYNQVAQLGAATGHVRQAAAEVAAMKSQIAAIVRGVPKSHGPETYYYELDPTYYSVTSTTFIGRALSLLGLTDIADAASGAASSGGYPQLSSEYIVQADPDYVFLADTVCCGQDAATVTARPGWSTIKAVTDGHVVGLNDDIASRWGPRIVDLMRTVAAALEPRSSTG
jgi:iron complex transport system substrate-binding protein